MNSVIASPVGWVERINIKVKYPLGLTSLNMDNYELDRNLTFCDRSQSPLTVNTLNLALIQQESAIALLGNGELGLFWW